MQEPGKQHLKEAVLFAIVALLVLLTTWALSAQEPVNPTEAFPGDSVALVATALEVNPYTITEALTQLEADAATSETALIARAARGIVSKYRPPEKTSDIPQYIRFVLLDLTGDAGAILTPQQKADGVNAVVNHSRVVIIGEAARLNAMLADEPTTVTSELFQ